MRERRLIRIWAFFLTILLTTVVLVLVTPRVANATSLGTVNIVNTGYGASGQLNVWGGGLYGASGRGGVYMLNKTNGTGQGNFWPNGLLGGFCIELSELAPTKLSTYDVVMPQDSPKPTYFLGSYIGPVKAEYLSELWGKFFDPNWVGIGPFSPQQNSKAEAFAAAVWEIIYEDLPSSPAGWNVTEDGTSGNRGFYCTNADTVTANNWLHSLNGTGPKTQLLALVCDGKQDYITASPPAGIPEPATIALFGIGGLALLRKKR
jgi:hypothetical protein